MCLANDIMCRKNMWPQQLDKWCRKMSIYISIPSIGSILGHSSTSSLELQHVTIVDMLSHPKLYIKLIEEVQRYLCVGVRGNIKNHVPSVHPMVSNWLTGAPLNGNMRSTTLWNVICPRNSKQCIYMIFCYFEHLNLILSQSINIFVTPFFLTPRY